MRNVGRLCGVHSPEGRPCCDVGLGEALRDAVDGDLVHDALHLILVEALLGLVLDALGEGGEREKSDGAVPVRQHGCMRVG
eukprot:4998431-Pleurochrysis_carterae.AAC.1